MYFKILDVCMYVYLSVGVLQKPRGKGLIFCFMKGIFYLFPNKKVSGKKNQGIIQTRRKT